MTNEDLRITLQCLRAVSEDVCSSKERALAYLVQVGIVTPSGELTEHYKQQ